MRVDVACVGAPFLDLIFRGLPALPEPGEELLAKDLVIVPGAMANVAFALKQLGLEAVVCAPIGSDPAGRLLRDLMAEAGVRWVGRPVDATPVSVALPAHGDRSFVTVAPPPAVDVEALLELEPRAVVVDLPSVDRLPPMENVYAVVGDPEVRTLAGKMPTTLVGLAALIVNDREARGLTGLSDEKAAARHLAALGTTVVVTCGSSGAFGACPDGESVRVEAPVVDVGDPTGAGDLFTAAYVWADLAGRGLEDRLELATRYASLSLAEATTTQKGLTRDVFEAGLAEGGSAQSVEEA
jgi:sugar/nucleoside kinase (ribokinase family)